MSAPICGAKASHQGRKVGFFSNPLRSSLDPSDILENPTFWEWCEAFAPLLALYNIWRNMKEYERLWGNMREYEGIWGNIWGSMREYEGIWGNMRKYERIWGNMSEYVYEYNIVVQKDGFSGAKEWGKIPKSGASCSPHPKTPVSTFSEFCPSVVRSLRTTARPV